MKKILSMILTISMILAIAATMGITIAAAPEGTAINNAAEFAGMAADGTYYLAADLTIDATYTAQFTGTLDGNGKTVTLAGVPMFHTLSGDVKNLNLAGEVTTAYGCNQTSETAPTIYPWGDVAIGGVAAFVLVPEGKTVTFDNIVSGAKVSFDGTCEYLNAAGETKSAGAAAGAIYGVGLGNITISNCTNNGEITGKDQVGGLAGWADRSTTTTLTVTNCVNNGTVNMAGNYGGGIVGRGSEGTNVFTNCVNNGAMNCYKAQFGGIVGYLDHSGNVTVTNCVNNGTPADINDEDTTYPNFGGMIGVSSAKVADLTVTIEGCINTASFKPTKAASIMAGGMAARLRSTSAPAKFIVKDCLNTGEFTNCNTVGGILGQVQGKQDSLSTLEITRCTNLGDITGSTTATSGTCRVGGIIGHTEWVSITADHCVNNGILNDSADTTGVTTHMGGILAYLGGKKEVYDGTVNTFNSCVNNGSVNGVNSAKSSNAGGIVGHTLSGITFNYCTNTGMLFSENNRAGGICASGGDSNKVRVITYNYCLNIGTIEGKQVGGISAYQYGSEDETNTSYAVVNGCVNMGGVTSTKGSYAAGMIAYYNAVNTTYKNNFNGGMILSIDADGNDVPNKASILGWDNKCAHKAENISGNMYVEGTCAQLFADYGAGENNAKEQVPAVYVAANADAAAYAKACTPGEAVDAINAAAGKEILVMRRTITPVCDHGYLADEKIEAIAPTCTEVGYTEGYFCGNCFGSVGVEEVPAAHTFVNGVCSVCGVAETDEAPAGGDSAWIYLVLAAVAVLGTAVVAKKRAN